MKIIFTIINIGKILIWIALSMISVHQLGWLWGVSHFAVTCWLWNFWSTIRGNHRLKQDPRVTIRAMFTASKFLWIIAYGNYDGPKFGDDNPITHGLIPIDGADLAGFHHDQRMKYAKTLPPAECKKEKMLGDLTFMGEMITSDNGCNGIYILGSEIGFFFRMIGRFFI